MTHVHTAQLYSRHLHCDRVAGRLYTQSRTPTNYKCPGHIHNPIVNHHVNFTQKHSAELRVGFKRYNCFCSKHYSRQIGIIHIQGDSFRLTNKQKLLNFRGILK